MTHAIVHLPGEPPLVIYPGTTADNRARGFVPNAAPSRPSLTIEVALTTHQVREPHDGDRD